MDSGLKKLDTCNHPYPFPPQFPLGRVFSSRAVRDRPLPSPTHRKPGLSMGWGSQAPSSIAGISEQGACPGVSHRASSTCKVTSCHWDEEAGFSLDACCALFPALSWVVLRMGEKQANKKGRGALCPRHPVLQETPLSLHSPQSAGPTLLRNPLWIHHDGAENLRPSSG